MHFLENPHKPKIKIIRRPSQFSMIEHVFKLKLDLDMKNPYQILTFKKKIVTKIFELIILLK